RSRKPLAGAERRQRRRQSGVHAQRVDDVRHAARPAEDQARGQSPLHRLRRLRQALEGGGRRHDRRARPTKSLQDGRARRARRRGRGARQAGGRAHRHGRAALRPEEPRRSEREGARQTGSREVAGSLAAPSADAPPRLVARGVTKSYGETRVLTDVSLELRTGSVHAMLGENGAGKSTLMKVLAGVERPNAGTLLLDGAPYAPAGPLEARRRGVAVVHQELSLCPHLTVADNIVLGAEPRRAGFFSERAAILRAERALGLVQAGARPISP